ncbi:dopamine beta-hydroxylase [Trichonephila inaurata madagascariensis]|uniref:Dopamine beta-hydroxylase n=1 Tax=Trichonephila inaurata madagascariensis TaxID=2747483 RepID=A0A8X6JLH7_9ARAC|nr:dopamine beta-hydroxylase [Trichonephila inaurata madagascariensis]
MNDLFIMLKIEQYDYNLRDVYTDEAGFVTLDDHDDCHLLSMKRRGFITRYAWSRKFDTCDNQDYYIEDGTTHILYAVGRGPIRRLDGINLSKEMHGFQRVQLLKNIMPNPQFPEDTKTLTIHNNKVAVPNVETTYWCTLHRLPANFESKNHIIQPFTYPEEAGLPIGGPEFSRYVMLEVHYNNPELKDAEGIVIFGSQLHTHLTGIKVYTKHIRGSAELPELNRDNHYSTHFQEIRRLKRKVRVLPINKNISFIGDRRTHHLQNSPLTTAVELENQVHLFYNSKLFTFSYKMATNRDDSSTFNLGDTNTKINKVAVKPPVFWRNKPKLWFLQLEAQFTNSGISNDTTKYNIVVAALDENVLDFVGDILSNTPHHDKYEVLKNGLLNRLTDTEVSRLKKTVDWYGTRQSTPDVGLVIKVAKCLFLQTEVDFLGYHISVNGIEPSKERIKVIEDFKLPETVKELRRYLGVINFSHRFIPNAAENQAILNNYLKGKKSNDKNKTHWTEESVQAFENSKQQL